MKWDINNTLEAYEKLNNTKVPYIVVGGQAVNLWIEYFTKHKFIDKSEWEHLAPLISKDLDLLNSGAEAKLIAERLGVKIETYAHSSRQISPNSGTLFIPTSNGELMVHCLFRTTGTDPKEIIGTAKNYEDSGVVIPLMHPLLCLEGKIQCYFTHPQETRQDLKHVKLSILALRAIIQDHVQKDEAEPTRSVLDRLLKLFQSKHYDELCKVGVDLVDAIPIKILEESNNPKLKGFALNEFPRLKKKLDERKALVLPISENTVKTEKNIDNL